MINKILIDNIISPELKEKGKNEQIILAEVNKMGEDAIKYYNAIRDDPFIIKIIFFDYGFICFSSEDTVRYIYIKPAERNKGWSSKIVKCFKISSASPEIIKIMDKNGLLYDLKDKGFKCINYSNKIIIYDVEVGYQITPTTIGLIVEYNKWNGEIFETVETTFHDCSLPQIRKKMKKAIKKLKTTNQLNWELIQNGIYTSENKKTKGTFLQIP